MKHIITGKYFDGSDYFEEVYSLSELVRTLSELDNQKNDVTYQELEVGLTKKYNTSYVMAETVEVATERTK